MTTALKQAIGIQQFKEKILTKSGGISSSNLYEFDVQWGPTLKSFLEDNILYTFGDKNSRGLELNMLCNEIQIPGVTMSSTDVKQVHKGITQKLTTAKVFNELDVSFYCDADSIPLKVFRAWQDFIVGAVETPKGQYGKNHNLTQARHQVYSQRYYDDYTCDLKITKLENYGAEQAKEGGPNFAPTPTGQVANLREAFTMRLANAYPYTVSSVPYSAAEAQLVKVTVGLYYEYSHMQDLPALSK